MKPNVSAGCTLPADNSTFAIKVKMICISTKTISADDGVATRAIDFRCSNRFTAAQTATGISEFLSFHSKYFL